MVVGVVQARMGSSRLPGKPLLPLGGETALGFLVNRLKDATRLDQLVVATSTKPRDDAITLEAARAGVECIRGSEENVLGRMALAGRTCRADIVVRITGDDALMDPQVVDFMVQRFESGSYAWATGLTTRSFPNGFVLSVISQEALERADAMSVDEVAREHAVLALLNRPDLFTRLDVVAPAQWTGYDIGVTLDTRAQYELMCEVVERLGANQEAFGIVDVLRCVRASPSLHEQARGAGFYWEPTPTSAPCPS